MMSLWFGKILLQETEERIGTTRSVSGLARSCYDLGSCGFRCVICGELCGKVGGNGGGDGKWWLSVGFYDSDVCIFCLCRLRVWLKVTRGYTVYLQQVQACKLLSRGDRCPERGLRVGSELALVWGS